MRKTSWAIALTIFMILGFIFGGIAGTRAEILAPPPAYTPCVLLEKEDGVWRCRSTESDGFRLLITPDTRFETAPDALTPGAVLEIITAADPPDERTALAIRAARVACEVTAAPPETHGLLAVSCLSELAPRYIQLPEGDLADAAATLVGRYLHVTPRAVAGEMIDDVVLAEDVRVLDAVAGVLGLLDAEAGVLEIDPVGEGDVVTLPLAADAWGAEGLETREGVVALVAADGDGGTDGADGAAEDADGDEDGGAEAVAVSVWRNQG